MQSWQQAHGFAVTSTWQRKHWVALLAAGDRPVQKIGSAGAGVFRVQRALNAAGTARLAITGVFDATTDAAVRAWQQQVGVPVTGVIAANSWKRLFRGER
jgi:peptidoglycan hydrolase-like protein with peptidoglycan-binding domain